MGCFLNKIRKKYFKNIEELLLEDSQIKLFYIPNKSTKINQNLLNKKRKPDDIFIFEKFTNEKEKKEQILPLTEDIEDIDKDNNSSKENNFNIISLNENNTCNLNNNNENKKIYKNKNNIISQNIINYIYELDLTEFYSFELISKILSFEVKKGAKKEELFHLILKNNGKIKWPKGESFLRYHAKDCPELILEKTPVGECDVGEKIHVYIKFGNLDNCKCGNYKVIFHFFIEDIIIGEPILVFFKIIE